MANLAGEPYWKVSANFNRNAQKESDTPHNPVVKTDAAR